MTITFQREMLAKVRPEVADLTAQHWDEVAHHKDVRTLDVDWHQFELMESIDNLFFMTARDDGALVGYTLALLRPHLHSKGMKTAYVDAIFMTPGKRHNNAGLRLLQHTDTALAALSDFIYWHVKPERDFSRLLARMGYGYVEAIWGRPTQQGVA